MNEEIIHQIMLTCYKEKSILIDEVGKAMSHCRDLSVSRVWYEAWYNKDQEYTQEWIVLEHVGGAIKVRNVNINSNSVNMKVLGMLVHESYYDEVETYKEFHDKAKADGWERIV